MAKVMEVLGYGEAQSKDAYIQHITELYNLKIEPKETFGEHLNRFKENFKDDEKKAAVDSFISDRILAGNGIIFHCGAFNETRTRHTNSHGRRTGIL